MKKVLSAVLAILLIVSALAAFTSCKKAKFTIAVPNDPSNETRALQLLEAEGLIKLKAGVENPTAKDIEENPYGIKIQEVKAAQIPSILADVDYAVINSNYALEAELTNAIAKEGPDAAYPNVIAVKGGTETSYKIKALVAAVNSKAVYDFVSTHYGDAVVCDLDPAKVNDDGFDKSVNYESLKDTTITVGATSVPHAEVLEIAKNILKTKNITLDIKVFSDYTLINPALQDGEIDANYFQHVPYLNLFNSEKGTNLVSVLAVHHEPMGIYSKTNKTLDTIKNGK